ncbi:uncharacterized protein LOC134817082 [Bolinopsis microptera]|uniref:uncharacterized protein LOC134817082 n=1 Tax=Bolinopsis microptera TaxID=2820187 RepID=UPI00307A6053
MQDGSNTPSSLAPWNRKRPNSDSDDSSSGPPCKRFQTSLNLAKPHSAPLNLASSSSAGFQGAGGSSKNPNSTQYSQINEVLKKAHFYSRAMRANINNRRTQ